MYSQVCCQGRYCDILAVKELLAFSHWLLDLLLGPNPAIHYYLFLVFVWFYSPFVIPTVIKNGLRTTTSTLKKGTVTTWGKRELSHQCLPILEGDIDMAVY